MKKYLLDFKSCVFYMYILMKLKKKNLIIFFKRRVFNDFLCCKEMSIIKAVQHRRRMHPIIQNRPKQNSQRGKEFNKCLPPNRNDDLCLFFCFYSSWRYFMMEYSTKLHKILYILYYFNTLYLQWRYPMLQHITVFLLEQRVLTEPPMLCTLAMSVPAEVQYYVFCLYLYSSINFKLIPNSEQIIFYCILVGHCC